LGNAVVALKVVWLAAACLVAFARPVWGFGITLLVTSTLFHLHQYLTVPLPVGFIEPTEALLASMLASAWLKRSGVPPTRNRVSVALPNGNGLPIGRACAIIGPYCFWQTLCIVVGLTHLAGTYLRFEVRSFLSEVLPWVSLYILATLSAEDGHKVFTAAYYLTLLTAFVHLALQLTDWRPAMNAAYWFTPANSEYELSGVQQQIEHEAFFRGLPQGLNLILFFTLLKLAEYVFVQGRSRVYSVGIAALLFAALFITVTRSVMIVLATGIAILVGLALLTLRVKTGHAIRIGSALCLFVVVSVAYDAVRPGFFGFWAERIEQFSGADSAIFSAENQARGLDNLAAMHAIRDYPVFGVGMGIIPEEYSLRDGPPTDTHPMLEIGLTGGLPSMVLILLLQTRLLLPALKSAFSHPFAARELVPFLSVLIMSAFALNMAGGGGTLQASPILFVTIFANEMWNRWPLALAGRGRRHMRLRTEKDDAIKAATHFGRNALI
jgi:hypothetical protein